MKRKLGVVGLAAAALLGVLFWRCHASGSQRGGATTAAKVIAADRAAHSLGKRGDPAKLARATIAGTITDEDHAAVPHARVCADLRSRTISAQLTREPKCTTADDHGRYSLGELYAGKYAVAASAKPYRPGAFHPGGDRKEQSFELAAGERKPGVDIVLRKGGVEITGTVSDVTGGPIAHALVHEARGWGEDNFAPPVETDVEGKFSLWVKPGGVSVSAQADGYASGSDSGSAPGTFEILLTPESSLSGTVVDAKTGEPLAGIPVDVAEGDWIMIGDPGNASDITDDHGKFHVSALQPGRYVASVQTERGFGRTEGSTLVGLGQHVEGAIVKVHAAYQVTGRVVLPDKTTCKHANVYLLDGKTGYSASALQESDGTLHADGMRRGSYHVSVDCDDYQARDKYAPVEIKDKDVLGLVWEVDAGATIKGRVVTKAGTPIEDAWVSARTVGGAARAKSGWNSDTSLRDGSFTLAGLKPGSYRLEVSAEKYNGPKEGWKVEVTPGASLQKDLVLDDGGSIKGIVVDTQQKPVGGVQVTANGVGGSSWGNSVRTKTDGSFQLDGIRPSDYMVVAHRGWWSWESLRKPGSTDDDKQGEKVAVAAGKLANVKLVVEAQAGVIDGTVIDPSGKPVSDAFVSAARESDAAGALGSSVASTRWSWDEKPVVSNLDGKFKLQKLSPGKYTLRAYRKGGGEAIAEHVAVGGNTKLQIRATGVIEGVVRRAGGNLEQLQIGLVDDKSGLYRHETFFRTDGRYVIRDLPQGNFMLTAETGGGKKQLAIVLGEGEHKSGVDITLDELVTLTGRVVDLVTKQPVAGMRMLAQIGKRNQGFSFSNSDDDLKNISGDDGRFTIDQAPRGPIMIRGMPKDWRDGEYGFLMTVRDVAGSGTVDIGDIAAIKKRLKRGEVAGELGVKFAEQPGDTPIDEQIFKVSYIDPKGPAAKIELKVGDVVTAIDGIDVTGAGHWNGSTVLRAPPGTAIKLGLARGATVTVVLAAP